ncbi:MAG: hypothetical protein Fur0042_27930 [Cyanophyceae cyanobacterium]
MGKAGHALRIAIETHGVTQYALAKRLGVERSNVYRWVREERDPTAERVLDITRALKDLNPEAARAFVRLYLGEEVDN